MRYKSLWIAGGLVAVAIVAALIYGCRDGKQPGPGPGPGPGPDQCEFPLTEVRVEDLEVDKPNAGAKVKIDPNPASLLHKLTLADRTASVQAILQVVKAERLSPSECKLQLRYTKRLQLIAPPTTGAIPGLYQVEVRAINGPFKAPIELSLRSGTEVKDIDSQEDAIKALTDPLRMKAGDVVVRGAEVDGKPVSLVAQTNMLLDVQEVKVVRSDAAAASKPATVELEFSAAPVWVKVSRQENGQWLMILAE